jgi:hypothetical protein
MLIITAIIIVIFAERVMGALNHLSCLAATQFYRHTLHVSCAKSMRERGALCLLFLGHNNGST